MRKSILAVLVAGLTLCVAAAALATTSFKQVAKVTLTAQRPGISTGVNSTLLSTDASAPGAKPKAAKRVVMTFPAGTRFNFHSSVSRVCTLSDAQLEPAFAPMCPIASQVGLGTALLNTMPMGVPLSQFKLPVVATVRAKVHAYVHSANSLIYVLYPNTFDIPGLEPIILHASAAGANLTVDIPKLIYGKAKKPKFPGVVATIISLKVNLDQTGTGSTALVTAGRCTAGRFAVTSRFTYRDGSTAVAHSSSRCS